MTRITSRASCYANKIMYGVYFWVRCASGTLFVTDTKLMNMAVNFQGDRHDGQRAVAAGWGS